MRFTFNTSGIIKLFYKYNLFNSYISNITLMNFITLILFMKKASSIFILILKKLLN
jgi:hypothetical protein